MNTKELMERVGENLTVGRSFGPSYESEGTLVIPVAVVGGGGGGGERKADESSGGGFGGVVYPLGAYVVRDGNVRFVPTFDATVLLTTALALVRLIVKRFGRAQLT